MSTSHKRIDQAASALITAYRSGQPLQTRPDHGPANEAEAYAVQRAVWQGMAGDARPTAWKVGAATREATPVAAPILPQCLAASPANFPARGFLRLGVEAEIALRFAHDLPARQTPYSRDEILAAVAAAHVAMELVDTRLADPEAAGPFWRLADSLLNGGLVLGSEIPDWRRLDLGALNAHSHADGQRIAEARGRQPLDDIYFCLPWWVAHIGGVRAGDIITTGSWNGAHWVDMPVTLRVGFDGLGSVESLIA